MSFGVPSRFFIFLMCVAGWFPGLLPWLCDNSNTPGMQNLRWNKTEAHNVARELIDSKREELRAGTPRKDLMSMLGSLLPLLRPFYAVFECFSLTVKANDAQRENLKLTDEEVISQIRWELLLRVTLKFACSLHTDRSCWPVMKPQQKRLGLSLQPRSFMTCPHKLSS